jgi:glycosyltransferase involved in cell wall biosynthesis
MQRSGDNVFNILHVVSKLPVGGVENVILREIQGYARNRFHASVCCMKEGGEIAIQLRKAGYNVEILNRMKGHGFDVGVIKDIYNFIKRENIHILRTHQYHANLYGRIAGILAGVTVMIPTFHNLYISPHKPKIHRRILNYILSRFSNTLVGVSEAVSADIMKFDWANKEKVKTIYNGIVITEYNLNLSKLEARSIFGVPSGLTVIGTVGRLTEQKGHCYLIEAVSQINNSCLVIAGGGPLNEELKRLAKSFKNNCIFLGSINPEKIPLFLHSLDIFCFPSLWEGLPISLIEAMASGLPIIATDIPPHREVLGNAGILVPVAAPQKIAEAMNQLIGNTQLMDTLAKRAKERARFFSIYNMVNSYEKLFENSLKAKGLIREV